MILHRLAAELLFSPGASPSPGRWGNLMRSISRSISQRRYTFWSGLLGGFFLSLSYFGTDQSQVQRYLAGGSLAGSRFGLLFNAILKAADAILHPPHRRDGFRFLSIRKAAALFQSARLPARGAERARPASWPRSRRVTTQVFAQKAAGDPWPNDRAESRSAPAIDCRDRARPSRSKEIEAIRGEVKETLKAADPKIETNDADYVFISFRSELSAAWRDWAADRGDFLRRDVLERFGIERARLDHGGRFLSAAAASERERRIIISLSRNCSRPPGAASPSPSRSSPTWSRT